jgi:hypothetical protein
MSYATPLAERQRISRLHRERYQRDPDYRLRTVNRARAWQGLPLYASPEQIGTRADSGRAAAAKAKRGERGRFA